jgi:hypothetical protein
MRPKFSLKKTLCACYLIALAGLASSPALAAPPKKPTLNNVGPVFDKQKQYTQQVDISFKDAVSSSEMKSEPSKWFVVVSTDDGQPPQILAVPVDKVQPLGTRAAYLTLPPGTLNAHTTSVEVNFGGSAFLWSANGAATSSGSFLQPATDKNTADIYLSGLYSPALHSAAQYTIDAQATLVKQLGLKPVRVGGTAVVATDKRPSADPDSFLVSGVLQWIPIAKPFLRERVRGALLQWNFAGLEFDRKSTTETFISSPVMEFPVRVYPAAKASDSTTAVSLIPLFGIQLGDNFENVVLPNGTGLVVRGMGGAMFTYSRKLTLPYLTQLTFTSNYTVRIPGRPEIFTYTQYNSATGKSTDLPMIGSQARHHVKNEFDITFAKPFSLTIKHEYGELPPTFRKINNSISIGLTVMFKQNNGAASQLDPEK